jgi:hypothetical protein
MNDPIAFAAREALPGDVGVAGDLRRGTPAVRCHGLTEKG